MVAFVIDLLSSGLPETLKGASAWLFAEDRWEEKTKPDRPGAHIEFPWHCVDHPVERIVRVFFVVCTAMRNLG